MATIIEKYIDECWALQITYVRYGSGLFSILSPVQHYIEGISDILTGSDLGAVELEMYFRDTGSWLPAAFAPNIEESLEIIESKLKLLTNHTNLHEHVRDIYYSIIKYNDGSFGLSDEFKRNPDLYKQDYVYSENEDE